MKLLAVMGSTTERFKTTIAEMADFVLDTVYEDLSAETTEAIKKRVLDAIAIAAGGGVGAIADLRRTVGELDRRGRPASGAPARRRRRPWRLPQRRDGQVPGLLDAYLLPDEVPHPSNNVSLAIVSAEYADGPGTDLITVIGVAHEIHYHLAKHAPLTDRGWDHGTYVSFSASAAAGSLFGLDRDELRNTIEIAGVGHNALRVARTGGISMWKGLAASNAARNAVILANNSMRGPSMSSRGKATGSRSTRGRSRSIIRRVTPASRR